MPPWEQPRCSGAYAGGTLPVGAAFPIGRLVWGFIKIDSRRPPHTLPRTHFSRPPVSPTRRVLRTLHLTNRCSEAAYPPLALSILHTPEGAYLKHLAYPPLPVRTLYILRTLYLCTLEIPRTLYFLHLPYIISPHLYLLLLFILSITYNPQIITYI